MGNEHSELPGIEIKEKPLKTSDFWTHHCASISNSGHISLLSVFIGDLFINEAPWFKESPLETASKNLMIYRHPCIIKYLSSWKKPSKFYLAVEEVTPLSQVLSKQTTLEISIGLHSILKALCFLHEKANVSHNNICIASIYVSQDHTWKLGGMEYARRYEHLNSEYLSSMKSHRYSKGIDGNESKHIGAGNVKKECIDVYSFATLVTELFNAETSFKDLCTKIVQEPDVSKRPQLNDLLEHEFFKHTFIVICSFLMELPLKSEDEKSKFFLSLSNDLKLFDQEVVASHLGGLLLSRLIFLNRTAQTHLLPSILSVQNGLFSEDIFKKYITPKLLRIFSVRDVQIRLILLSHFHNFMQTFSKEQLESCILPELLVGIKDTNDELVAATLKVLANLVTILGSSVVIGGQRAKLFNDGRPVAHNSLKRPSRLSKPDDRILPTITLPERPSPDGEEGETSTEELETFGEDDLENWEDWNNENEANEEVAPAAEVVVNSKGPSQLIDINKLDIKSQANGPVGGEDMDFFQDMEPVIETKSKFVIEDLSKDTVISSKLVLAVDDGNEDGWGNDEWN